MLWKNVFSKEKSIIWVGSGLSKGFYKDWNSIIVDLCKNCGVNSSPENSAQYLKVADLCKNNNPIKYKKTLYEEYGKKVYKGRDAHYLLFNISTKGFLTTNFDSKLEDALKIVHKTNSHVYYYPKIDVTDITQNNSLFYIHGNAKKYKGDDLIFTETDFNSEYNTKTGRLRMFLNPILLNYSIFFIGYSLSEPSIRETFNNIKRLMDEKPNEFNKPKYLLQPSIFIEAKNRQKKYDEVSMNTIEFEFERDYGVEILWYDAYEIDGHYEIEKILEILVEYSLARTTKDSIQGMDTPNG